MPLTMAIPGQVNKVKKIGGRDGTKKFLANLGLVVGSDVTVISKMAGNLIVNIKDSRIAISQEMANKIIV